MLRPDAYFREDKDGSCPPELTLRIEQPALRDGPATGMREWKERVTRCVALKVAAAHQALREAGREFLGRAAVLATSFIERARSYETRFGVIPTFAAKARSVREGLRRVERHFRARYRKALEQWRDGWREVTFPVGTWGMAVWHSVVMDRAEARGWWRSQDKTNWYMEQLAANGLQVLSPSQTLKVDLQRIGEQLTGEWLKKSGADGRTVIDVYKSKNM